MGIYRADQTPGGPGSTLWNYVDGTRQGDTGLIDGTIVFDDGLTQPGLYTAYLLENDSYNILASNSFSVVEAASSIPRVVSAQPADGAKDQLPLTPIVVTIGNGGEQGGPDLRGIEGRRPERHTRIPAGGRLGHNRLH